MLEQAEQRTIAFQQYMADEGLELAIITDESSIAYLAGFWGYLSIEFGRPTFLIIRPEQAPIVVTPLMESEMVAAMTWVDNILTWEDVGEKHWGAVLATVIGHKPVEIAVEAQVLPAIVRDFLDERYQGSPLRDISHLLRRMRMIKSKDEIAVMHKAGDIATAMVAAAADAIAEGVPEYEAALAIINAGTRKAAGFLTDRGWERFVSPLIHNLQIMQSGSDTSMVHRRASVKKLRPGDPVYFCFCNMAQFMQYKLGFDRMFFVGTVSKQAAHVQEVAIRAQQAALDSIHPGVTAESVAAAANSIYRQYGFEPGYRTGRSIGMAYLEAPELKEGDKTELRPGMTFAVDGGISVAGKLGGRIGDSVVVTETGFEFLTHYPRDLLIV